MSEHDEQDDSLEGVERELLQGQGARLAVAGAGPGDSARARLVVQRFRARERQRKLLLAGGSALSLAAAAALVVGLNRGGAEGASTAQASASAQQSPLVVESGSVTLPSGLRVAPGAPVVAQTLAALGPSTCLRAGKSVRLCTQGGAKLKLPPLGGAWLVELAEGAITAELLAMPAGFALSTQHGSAAVEGTLFGMELDTSRAFTTVMVERGRVRVTNQRLGEQALLLVGQSARLGERLELNGPGSEQAASQAPVPQQAPVAQDASAPRASAPASSGQGQSPAELLEEARQQRGSGHYGQAAQVYRRLVQQHPGSAEARAALVSLGQLELGQLGQPEAALRSFRAYLAGSGQLRQEAEHGVIQALQRLGRKDEERRAIEAFLARYPKSTQAGPLSERLKQL